MNCNTILKFVLQKLDMYRSTYMSWDIFWSLDDLGPMTDFAQRSSPGLSLSEDGALSAWRRKKVLDLVSHTVAGLVWNKVGWWMDCLLVPVHLPTPNERNGMDAKKQRKTNKKWNKVGWWTPNERIGCENKEKNKQTTSETNWDDGLPPCGAGTPAHPFFSISSL